MTRQSNEAAELHVDVAFISIMIANVNISLLPLEIQNTRFVGALRAPPRSLRLPGENTYFLQAPKFKNSNILSELKVQAPLNR